MRGDLLFYASSGRWYERLIVWATKGPYVHVAIDLGDGTMIEARAKGIVSAPRRTPSATYSPKDANSTLAFAWLEKRVGKSYGWLDILSQVLRYLGLPLYIGGPNQYDCSDLAACFAALYANDQRLLTQVLNARQDISPNDLAHYFGVTG